MRRQAVQRDRVRRGAVEQRVAELERRQRLAAAGGLALLVAHRDPDVGVDGVGAGDGLRRVGGQHGARHRFELVAVRGRDAHLDASQRAEDRERARDVVAVADVGEHAALDRPVRLPQRHQVGQRLAGVVQRREHVHDRHRRVRGQLGELLLRAGAQPDRRDVTREDQRGVPQRLAARQLQVARAQHHRVAAELHDARLERRARPRRRLLEQQRDRPVRERARPRRLGLERQRAVQQRGQLPSVELGSVDEVQARQCTGRVLECSPVCAASPPRS